MDWFERLSYGPQVDDLVVSFFNGWVTWVHGLSLNQRLAFAMSTIVALFVVNWLFKMIFRIFVTVRRWLRRRCIPKKINLHLDREQDQHIETDKLLLGGFRGLLVTLLFIGIVGGVGVKIMKSDSINDKPDIGTGVLHRDIVKHYDQNTLTVEQIEQCLAIRHYQDQNQSQAFDLRAQLEERKLYIQSIDHPTNSDVQAYNVLIEQYQILAEKLDAVSLEWNSICANKRYYLEDYNHSQFTNTDTVDM
jgi:hypothetical protein